MWKWWTSAKALRWLLALLIVLVGTLVWASGSVEICDDRLAAVGTDPVVRVCSAPTLSSPAVIGWLLAVLFLLAPDVTEISVGLFSLKQKVEQESKETREVVESLSVRVNGQLAQIARQAQDLVSNIHDEGSTIQVVQGLSPEQMEDLLARAQQRAVKVLRSTLAEEQNSPDPPEEGSVSGS